MSKGYTKQEVQQWQESVSKDPPMVAWAKSKEESTKLVKEGIRSYEYELFLSHDVDQGFLVDCREDVVENGDVVSSEYEEGYIFDDYFEAKAQLNKRIKLCEEHNEKYFVTDEVKTLHHVTGKEIKPKEEPTLWTVDLNTIFKNILFECTEDELEQNVQEFVISELENLDWTYEKADINVSKTMITS